MRSWLLVLLIAIPATSAAVAPQQSLTHADSGIRFGNSMQVVGGAALVPTFSEGFPSGSEAGMYHLARTGTTWTVAQSLPMQCDGGGIGAELLGGPETLHHLGVGRLYIGYPCRGDASPDPLGIPGSITGAARMVFGPRQGVVERQGTDGSGLSLEAVHGPLTDGFVDFARGTIAGDGWFAVFWSSAPFLNAGPPLPGEPAYQESISLYVGDATTPAVTVAAPVGSSGQLSAAAYDKHFFVRVGMQWQRYDIDGDVSGPFPQTPPPGVGTHGTRVYASQGQLVVLEGAPAPVETARLTLPDGYPIHSVAAAGQIVVAGSRPLTHCEGGSALSCSNVVDRPGTVFAFRRAPDGMWRLHETIEGPRSYPTSFGSSVAVSGTQILIGDPTSDDDRGRVYIRTMNQWPTARFTYFPEEPLSLTTVAFRDLSTDPEGQALTQAWDFDGDGETDATGPTATWRFTRPGIHTVRLVVTDTQEGVDVAELDVDVQNRVPEAAFHLGPSPLWRTAPLQATDLSKDLDGAIATWRWDFGDGRTSTAQHPVITYDRMGTYKVGLTVTDDFGASATVERTYQVVNHPPIVSLAGPDFAPSLEPLQVSATATDPDGHIVSMRWLGQDQTGQQLSITPQRAGTLRLVFEAVDNDGGRTVAMKDIEILNRAPTADFRIPSTLATRTPILFQDMSSDPDGSIRQWKWDFGDGNTTTDPSPTHAFRHRGDHQVTLEVIDDLGASSGPLTRTVSVDNEAPQARFVVWREETVFRFLDASEDADGRIVAREWLIDGQAAPHGTEWALDLPTGTRHVRLTVTDDRGATSTMARQVGHVEVPLRVDRPAEPKAVAPTPETPTSPAASQEEAPTETLADVPDPVGQPPPSGDPRFLWLLVAALLGVAVLWIVRPSSHIP